MTVRFRRRAAACAALLVALLAPHLVNAQPHGVRLTLFDDPSSSVAVSWNSDNASDTELVYGTSPAALTTPATATAIAQPGPLFNTFTARLTGLSPNTTYFYRVGRAGAYHPADGESPFQFTTMSDDPCDPFSFIVIGDNRADIDGPGVSDLWAGILDEAMAHDPAFFVNTGDMVKNGDQAGEWAAFVDASEGGWAFVPSILTLGNHDNDADGLLYKQLYEHATNTKTDDEQYYALDIGPIHFTSLDANLSGTELTDMVDWLGTELGASSQPWQIVFHHHAIYSRGNHSSGEDNNGALNANLIPLYDAHDVDFVFNGHSHNYERYVPSVGVDGAFGGGGRSFPAGDASSLAGADAIPDGTTGTTYLVSGGAGALTTDVFGFTCKDAACSFCLPGGININCVQEVFDNDAAANAVYDGRHGFAIFNVAADHIDVEVWASNTGNLTDAEIVDTFSMDKPSFPMALCNAAPGADAGPNGGTPDAAPDPGTIDAGPGNGSTIDASAPGGNGGSDSGGCGCRAGGAPGPGAPLLLLALAALGGPIRWRGSRGRARSCGRWRSRGRTPR